MIEVSIIYLQTNHLFSKLSSLTEISLFSPSLSQCTLWCIACLGLLTVGACGQAETEPPRLTIAVAASLVLPTEELVKTYTQQTGVNCKIISGSSGKLTAQIKAGAPYDVFLSADLDYPNALYQQGFTEGEPIAFARGHLGVYLKKGSLVPGIFVLEHEEIKTIAVPNPEVAPYGRAAVSALKKAGIYAQIEHKLVYGESVGQVNQFLHSGAVDAGVTATTIGQQNWSNYVIGLVADSLYAPLYHGAVRLKKTGIPAEQWMHFLQSAEGQAILRSYGL